ncbi:MAG: MtnX-like HAD-IB family phosphatase [Deltaproteobacteria bacterium]|nr:MtnX-like HAD-IB family phosphatase [Deltaproteobacteria bacterium]
MAVSSFEIHKMFSRFWGPTPLPFKVVVFSDFDGTISNLDTLKHLLNQKASPEWKFVEEGMASGQIAEREGLQQAFNFLNISFPSAMKEVFKKVSLDPSFKYFADWLDFEGHSLSVLSGGFKKLIQPLMDREGLQSVKVLANDVQVSGKSWKVIPCEIERLCSACNHCKSSSLFSELKKDPQTFIVYIGDGHTDICPVQLADLVFAKGFLKTYCDQQGIESVGFDSFWDVRRELKRRLRLLNRQMIRMSAFERRKQILDRCEAKLGWSARKFLDRAAASVAA